MVFFYLFHGSSFYIASWNAMNFFIINSCRFVRMIRWSLSCRLLFLVGRKWNLISWRCGLIWSNIYGGFSRIARFSNVIVGLASANLYLCLRSDLTKERPKNVDDSIGWDFSKEWRYLVKYQVRCWGRW